MFSAAAGTEPRPTNEYISITQPNVLNLLFLGLDSTVLRNIFYE